MWRQEATIVTKASKEQIWKLWTDVSSWNQWDDQVVESSLKGEFSEGAKGFLVPKGGPKSAFQLIEVTPERSFTSRANLPLTKMDFVHVMQESNGQLTLTHRIEFSGMFTFLFSRLIGKKLIAEVPQALEKLVSRAESV